MGQQWDYTEPPDWAENPGQRGGRQGYTPPVVPPQFEVPRRNDLSARDYRQRPGQGDGFGDFGGRDFARGEQPRYAPEYGRRPDGPRPGYGQQHYGPGPTGYRQSPAFGEQPTVTRHPRYDGRPEYGARDYGQPGQYGGPVQFGGQPRYGGPGPYGGGQPGFTGPPAHGARGGYAGQRQFGGDYRQQGDGQPQWNPAGPSLGPSPYGPPQYGPPQYGPPYAGPYGPPYGASRRRRRRIVRSIIGSAAAVVVVAIGAAFAMNSDHTIQTAGNTTAAGGTKTAGVGTAITLAGIDSGEQMKVTVTKVITAAEPGDEFSSAPAGDRLYAVQFQLRDTGSSAYSDAPSNGAVVIDTKGQSYTSGLENAAGCTSFAAPENIAPGATGLGCIVFEVPEKVTITGVQFTLDSGLGPQTGQWNVG